MFRTGETSLARRNSCDPSKETSAAGRYIAHRRQYGPIPYTKWAPLTDTANTLYEAEVTGNQRLPKTKEEWVGQMAELRKRLHLMYLCGMGPRNMPRCYNKMRGSTSPVDKEEEENVFDANIKLAVFVSLGRDRQNNHHRRRPTCAKHHIDLAEKTSPMTSRVTQVHR